MDRKTELSWPEHLALYDLYLKSDQWRRASQPSSCWHTVRAKSCDSPVGLQVHHIGIQYLERRRLMRIAIGDYKGMTAEELVERDPALCRMVLAARRHGPDELRQEVRAALAESRLDRLSYQYDRLAENLEAMKRQRTEERVWVPSAEEVNFEKVRADGLQRELADACRMMPKRTGNWPRSKRSSRNFGQSMPASYARPATVRSRRRLPDPSRPWSPIGVHGSVGQLGDRRRDHATRKGEVLPVREGWSKRPD